MNGLFYKIMRWFYKIIIRVYQIVNEKLYDELLKMILSKEEIFYKKIKKIYKILWYGELNLNV